MKIIQISMQDFNEVEYIRERRGHVIDGGDRITILI